MKIVKGILIAVFTFLILLNICLTTFLNASLHKMSTLILLLLVLVLIYKKRTWWIIGICIFTYGIFDFLFTSFYQSGAGALEFTSTLNTFIFGGYTGNPLRHIIHLFPFAFYTVSLIVFLTKPVRRQYHITE
jgi:hypothetical protein